MNIKLIITKYFRIFYIIAIYYIYDIKNRVAGNKISYKTYMAIQRAKMMFFRSEDVYIGIK